MNHEARWKLQNSIGIQKQTRKGSIYKNKPCMQTLRKYYLKCFGENRVIHFRRNIIIISINKTDIIDEPLFRFRGFYAKPADKIQ